MLKKIKNFLGGAGDEPTDQPEQSSPSAADDESSNAGKKPTDLATVNVNAPVLKPIKNWSHVFQRNSEQEFNVFKDLTDLSKAAAGSYPLGMGGLWHGGVHFDSGTAEVYKQTSVSCLADGEVVAYRVDKRVPTTLYKVNGVNKEHPFSRNFVLVRHILEAPKIKDESPPRLMFYSLYMHLQSWGDYESDPSMARPEFWSEESIYSVPMTAKDTSDKLPGQVGLKIYYQPGQGQSHDLLPQGTQVSIGGEGEYRKLENTPGPQYLQDPNASDSLLGYVQFDRLKAIGNNEYRVEKDLNVHVEATSKSKVIGAPLPAGTQLEVSGAGDFVKLERVNQYVHFESLQSLEQPKHFDKVVVLKELGLAMPIKAGDLIGHVGQYQDYAAGKPEGRLHLEVFSEDNVEAFINKCQGWAKKLPDTSKTLLKFVKGTAVVAHQDNFSAKHLPVLSATDAISAADLLVPKSLLDDLPAKYKIQVPATAERKACNWYYLKELLHSANNKLLSGWVREEVGVTPWVSPWTWEGYDIITDYTQPLEFKASFIRRVIVPVATGKQAERYAPMADAGDKGPIKSRLYDIIHRNPDEKLSGEELQAAIRMPAHAQSIAQLVIHCENEWYYTDRKWDLDGILRHSPSTPHKNWMAEKGRIKHMSWWGEVADKVELPADGKVYHLHPLGLMGQFRRSDKVLTTTYRIYQSGLIEKIVPKDAVEEQIRDAHYIYVDESGDEHDFGVFKGTKAKRWVRKYVKGSEDIYLMNASGLGSNPAKKFGFRFVETPRTYLNQYALASLIGAFMEVGYLDIASTGFSHSDGTPDPSDSHINGENGDFKFLRIDYLWDVKTHINGAPGAAALDESRQASMIEALYKFGWGLFYAWPYSKDGKSKKMLPRTLNFPDHHHHLHIGKYSPRIKEVRQ